MTSKEEIIQSLEGTISTLEQATKEREEELRSLLYVCGVSKIDDVDDVKLYLLGSELDNQIDNLKDLIDSIKFQLKYIATFKNV